MHNLKLQDYIIDGSLKIIVKPNSPKTEIIGYDELRKAVKIAVNAVPDKDKANIKLIKFLNKQLNSKVEIISGRRNREKIIKIM